VWLHELTGGFRHAMSGRGNLFAGEMVRLVAPSREDAAILARWSEDASYLRALNTSYARPLSEAEFNKRLDPEQRDPNWIEFHVRTISDDKLIGFVALHTIEWNNATAMLSVGIGEPDYRDRGYGSEALRLVLRYAFEELNLFRVGLDVIAANDRAVHVYEKLGFQHEGIMRRAVHREDRRYDVFHMGILRDEWNASFT
jgi:RimJ/RimL family protein N-acetyltransferase